MDSCYLLTETIIIVTILMIIIIIIIIPIVITIFNMTGDHLLLGLMLSTDWDWLAAWTKHSPIQAKLRHQHHHHRRLHHNHDPQCLSSKSVSSLNKDIVAAHTFPLPEPSAIIIRIIIIHHNCLHHSQYHLNYSRIMLQHRQFHSSAVINDKLLLIGGVFAPNRCQYAHYR